MAAIFLYFHENLFFAEKPGDFRKNLKKSAVCNRSVPLP